MVACKVPLRELGEPLHCPVRGTLWLEGTDLFVVVLFLANLELLEKSCVSGGFASP